MKSINVISITVVHVVVVLCYPSQVVRGQEHFLAQIRTINEEVERWFNKESKFATSFKAAFGVTNDAHRQSESYCWPRQMMKVLQVAIGVPSSSPVDMTRAAIIAAGLKHNSAPIVKEFQVNFGQFLATKLKNKDKTNDLVILKRETEELCGPYRLENKGNFNFGGAIADLILSKETENVDVDFFIDRVVNTLQPIATLYTSAMICRAIDAMIDEMSVSGEFTVMETKIDSGNVVGDWPYASVSEVMDFDLLKLNLYLYQK